LFEIQKLFVFKFDSKRKLMSVLIQMNNEYFLLTKGADSSVAEWSLNGKAE